MNVSVCESRQLFRWVKQKLPEKASVLAGLGVLLLRAGDWRRGGDYCKEKKRGEKFAWPGTQPAPSAWQTKNSTTEQPVLAFPKIVKVFFPKIEKKKTLKILHTIDRK